MKAFVNMGQGRILGPLAAAVLLSACAVVPRLAASQPAVGSLTGHWTLDADASDDPGEKLESITEASRETRRQSRVSAGVSVFGIPLGDVTDLMPERDRGGESGQDPPRQVTDSIDELDIVQSDDAVRVDYDGLGTFLYRNAVEMSDADGSVHAQWRRGRYIVERQITNGPLVTEEFRLDSRDAERLYWVVTLKFESRRDISITRVFDRAPAGSTVNNG